MGVVLGSRLDGGGKSFYKVWLSCSGFNLLPLFTYRNCLPRFLKGFPGSVKVSLISPSVSPLTRTLPFVCVCGGKGLVERERLAVFALF